MPYFLNWPDSKSKSISCLSITWSDGDNRELDSYEAHNIVCFFLLLEFHRQ